MGRRGGRLLLTVATPVLLAGCFLTGQDDRPTPSTFALYSTGTATIAIQGGETITLDEVVPGSTVSTAHGSEIRWTGPSGWQVRVSNVGVANTYGSTGLNGGYLVLDRKVSGRQQTTHGDTRCTIHIDSVDPEAIRGTATCKDVRWYDASAPPFEAGEPPPLDEPSIDADVTFEAARAAATR